MQPLIIFKIIAVFLFNIFSHTPTTKIDKLEIFLVAMFVQHIFIQHYVF